MRLIKRLNRIIALLLLLGLLVGCGAEEQAKHNSPEVLGLVVAPNGRVFVTPDMMAAIDSLSDAELGTKLGEAGILPPLTGHEAKIFSLLDSVRLEFDALGYDDQVTKERIEETLRHIGYKVGALQCFKEARKIRVDIAKAGCI